MKTAFITGITGQDGAYLSQLLLEKGYKVIGGIRRSSSPNIWRLQDLKIQDDVELVPFDVSDQGNVTKILKKYKPEEFYNLAAQSFVASSFEQPHYTADVDGLGVLNCLEAIYHTDTNIRFYQASTSELFGKVVQTPQKETTPFYPRSPYAAAKLYGHWITVNYRESYDMYACSGILFNHESPLRGTEFVTRKISSGLALYLSGQLETIYLGNIYAKRDWGFAKDYVEGMYLMLQQEQADDYVLATNETHTIKEFIDLACKVLNLPTEWKGSGIDEKLIDLRNGKTIIAISEKYFRPAEVDLLLGDASKAKKNLGWERKTSFEELVAIMVEADYKRIQQGQPLYYID